MRIDGEEQEREGIALQLNWTVVMLGIVLTTMIFAAMGTNFFLPLTDALGDALSFGGTNQSKPVNSAKGMALAVSCTSIMNSHPTETGNVNRYWEEWRTPMNQQGFGSSISFSCEDTVPEEGERGDERGAWFAPPEENGVNVVCEGYNQSGKGCKIYNFALPQDVPYTGPDTPEDVAGNLPQNIINAWGGPEYVLYYQSVSSEAIGNWQKRGQGISGAYIVGGLILEAVGLGIGGRLAGFARKAANKVGLTRLYRGVRAATRETDVRFRKALQSVDGRGAGWAADRAYQISKGLTKATMKIATRGPISGTGWIGRRLGFHTLGFLARKTSDLPASIIARMSSSGVSDEFYTRVVRQYRREMAERMAREGMPGLRRTADGGVDFANGMDKETWIRQYAQMSEESLEQAVRDVGNSMARRNQLPVSGDTLWSAMRTAEAGSVSASEFAQRQAAELRLNVEAASSLTRNADDVGGKWGALIDEAGPEAAASYGRQIKMTSDQLVNDMLPQVDEAMTFSQALRSGDGISAIKSSVSDYAGKITTDEGASTFSRFTDSDTAQMIGAGMRGAGRSGAQVGRGAAAFVCSSPTVQAEFIDQVSRMMDPEVDAPGDGDTQIEENQADAFKALGRCGVLGGVGSGTFGSFCNRMGVGIPSSIPASNHDLQATADYVCAATTYMGYAANRMLAERQYKTPKKVNSLYLAPAMGPNTRLPLHPIANWFFVGLDRGGSNPDDRFFLASPMETRRIQDADNAYIAVRPGAMENTISGRHLAEDDIGPNDDTEDVSSCDDLIGKVAEGVQGAVEGTAEAATDLAGVSLSCEGDIDGNESNGEEDLMENEEQVDFEEALACGKAGTYLKTSNDCTDELVYINKPQVRKTPGPSYALNPQAGVPSPPSIAGFLFEGTYDDASAALEDSDEDETGLFIEGEFLEIIGLNHSQVPESEYDEPSSPYTTQSFVIPETGQCDEIQVGICEDRVSPWSGDESCSIVSNESLSGPWYGELDDETEVNTVGVSCVTEDDGTSLVAADNVQQMQYLSPGRDRAVGPNYFRQLWYWDDPLNDTDCQGEDAPDNGQGNCMFNWKDNRGQRPKSQEVSGDGDDTMTNMYPRVYPEETGVTVYQDSTSIGGLFSGFTDWLNAKKQSKTKEYRSIIVSVENAPSNNWKRDDGKAVYGYNGDIDKNAWAKAALTTLALGAAVVITVGSFGTGAAVGAAALGVADVVGNEYISYASTWPNH